MTAIDAADGPTLLRLRAADLDVLFAHVRAEVPNEACGLFAGTPDGTVTRVYPCPNAEASPVRYRIDGRDQLRIFRDAESAGADVIGCFHSHTRSPARPSATDIREAAYPEWIYAIVSLSDDDVVLRAWRIVRGVVTELPVMRDP